MNMANGNIRISQSALRRIINSPGVARLVDQTGQDMARRATSMYRGPAMSTGRNAMAQDYRATTGRHGDYGDATGGRPVCYVHPHGILAHLDEARGKTLERAVTGGGR